MKYSLKELRARKGKTQKQVAADLGITYQTYNAWEKNPSNLRVSKVMELADYFGVTLDEIFLPDNLKRVQAEENVCRT